MTLYEIDKKIEAAIMNAVDEETGEITEDFALLDELQLEREQKIENSGLYIKNLNAEIESLKAEEKALYERRKSKEKHAEWLKGYLTYSLDGALIDYMTGCRRKKKMLKLIKNYFKKFFIEKDSPKSTDITLRGVNRNGEEYAVTIPTFSIERDSYHTEPCFIRVGKRK